MGALRRDRFAPRLEPGDVTDMARTRSGCHIFDPSPAAGSGMGHQLWHTLTRALFSPYRPELHYMRGPGPKWHEKHDSRSRQVITSQRAGTR